MTYAIKGKISHEDFCGHQGIIGPGDLQWMTAGKGIVHSEMPVGEEPCVGLQLWINLPREHKMMEPRYQELRDSEIPRSTQNGVHVKVIAGESMGTKSPIYTITPTLYLDFKLDKSSQFSQPIPNDWNAFIFVLKGTGVFGEGKNAIESEAHHTLVLDKGESILFRNEKDEQLHIVLIAGKPINEPIVQHGPFVMNTDEEIRNTIKDYRYSLNGFQKAAGWQSENTK